MRAFGNRSFLLLWSGQTTSRVGDFLYQVAVAWWVLEATGSAGAVATLFILSFIPMLIFLLVGGVLVDRFSRARVMLASDVGRGLLTVGVAFLALTGSLRLEHLYVASAIFGLVDAFFQPAYAAFVPDLVAAEDLPSANSLSSLGVQGGRIIGPVLGAAIVALAGTGPAFAVNAATFFVSSACLVPLLRVKVPRPADRRLGVAAEFREGIRAVTTSPWLWISILVFALSNVALGGPYAVALPFLVSDHLRADVTTLGFLYAMFPIGYVISSVWFGRKAVIRRRGLLIYGGQAVAGAMLFVFGLPVPALVMALAAVVNGAALEAGSLAWTNLLQEKVPREKLGRVVSIDTVGSFGLLPIGYGVTGWATDAWGPPAVFLLGGGFTALVASLVYLGHEKVRRLD